MEDNNLLDLTADVVAAHVGNNNVSVNDVPRLIQEVHAALAGLGEQQASEPKAKREPVVSPRASVKSDHLVCMVCGKKQKTLKRHLQNAHGMSPSDYRREFGLKSDYPMVAPEYSERRSKMAKSNGLGQQRKKEAPKRGRKTKEEGASEET